MKQLFFGPWGKVTGAIIENLFGLALIILYLRTGKKASLYLLAAFLAGYAIQAIVQIARAKPWAPRCSEPCDCGCGRPCCWAQAHEGKHQS